MKLQNVFKSVSITTVLLLGIVGCMENKIGTVDLDLDEGNDEEVTYTYEHPCALYNEDDFTRVKASIATGVGDVYTEFNNLEASPYAQLAYNPTPQTQIVRGDYTGTDYTSENYVYAMKDAAAAYQQALLWKLTDNDEYAANAIDILNQWAATCDEITSNDANHYLAAGAQGYTFANAGELLRDYDGWSDDDFSLFKTWMVDVFAAKNYKFLTEHSNASDTHYWANWDLVNMSSYLAIGILTENDEMVTFVKNYFYKGVGNGCLEQLIIDTHDDPLNSGQTIAQCQESGRDQGHATMVSAVSANLCQMAYTLYLNNTDVPELDFFAANDNVILKMCEYTALFNYRNGSDNANSEGSYIVSVTAMPFTSYTAFVGESQEYVQTQVSEDGRGTARPGWEIIYNHYAKVKGLSSGFQYTQMFAEKLRPEGGSGDARYGSNSGAFDQLGWGTLMMYRD
ncbi:alginate lyase family protein [Geofilum sp. OHC36d9]|uniref:alginate lyase family protein n=1 Tax=Geofilum sp. OHC36d9 TaxID=3458413 RepID=UPI004034E322